MELLSLQSDGSWISNNYTSFLFDGDMMTVSIKKVSPTDNIVENYAVEVVQDISPLEGIYRFHGSGSLSGYYVGITAVTNGGGSFAKMSFQKSSNEVLQEARMTTYWEYASDILVNRIFKEFSSEKVVHLDSSDEKYYVSKTTNVRFSANNVMKASFEEVLSTGTKALGSFDVVSVQLFGVDKEIYRLSDGTYFGVEYQTNTVLEKLQMKFAKAAAIEDVLSSLILQSQFLWESEKTASIPHRVLEKIKDRPIVTLTRFTAPPIGTSPSSIVIEDAYDWENTTQYGLDIESMKMQVIEVADKISNVSEYRIKMISDESDTVGIFQFLGKGLLNGIYAKLSITNEHSNSGWIVLSQESNKFDQQHVTNRVQDNYLAQQPQRVLINMQTRGKVWVGVQESGIYCRTNTTNWTFHSENLLVQAKILTNSTPMTSTYKIKMIGNYSEDKGIFLLENANNQTLPQLGTDSDTSRPFENHFFAVKLGAGVNNGRALMEIGLDRSVVEQELETRTIQNLHEQSVVPSANKIVKTLAGLSPWVQLNNNYYLENNTEVWWFDSDTMEAVVMKIQDSGGSTVTNASRYELEMQRDVGNTEGAFKLIKSKNTTEIKTDYPNNTGTVISGSYDSYADHFMYVTTGTATTANKAYIGTNNSTVDEAKNNKPITPNYHTRLDAPLSAEAVESAVSNAFSRGHTYVKLGTPATKPSAGGQVQKGSYLPYDTTEYVFSVDPLQVVVTTISRNNSRTTETYPLQIVKAENQGKAVVKYLGTGTLSGQFAGLVVEDAANAHSRPTGTYLVFTNAATMTDALDHLNQLINANQWTHNLKSSEMLGNDFLMAEIGPWVSVDNIGTTSQPNYTNRFFDRFNTTNIKFDNSARQTTVLMVVKGVTNEVIYDYEVMHTNADSSTKVSNTILYLSGSGEYNGKFVGFSMMEESPGATKIAQFAEGQNFDAVQNALRTAHTNFYKEADLPQNDHILYRADSRNNPITRVKRSSSGSVVIPSIRDSVVKLDEKGIYDSEDTKELFFNALEQTVTVAVTKGTMNKSYKYHVIFSKDSSNFQNMTDTEVKKELQSRFYLKSAEGDQTAPWHKHFVEMKVEAGEFPKKVSFYAGNVSPTETSNEFEKKYGSFWNYSDKSGTALDMKAIVSASSRTWTKLVMDPNYDKSTSYCYYDPQKVEHWTFDAAQKTVRIVSTNGSDHKDETYRIGMKDSISETKGIFVLAGSTGNQYDGRMVYLDLGDSASGNDARIVMSHQGSQEAEAIAKVKELQQKLENNKQWNFREQTLAMLEAKAIVSAAKVTEWRSLSGNTGGNLSYDGNNYVSLKFEANTVQNHARYTNIKISVHGNPGSFSSMAATDFGYKMHQDDSATRGIFQLIRGDNAQFTNKYVAIELGTAVNDRLMKVGFGDTPAKAQEELNKLSEWNYMDVKQATAGERVLNTAIARGSDTWVSFLQNPIQENAGDPHYSSLAVTNLKLDSHKKTIKVQYVTTPAGQDSTIEENVYGYTMIEDNSETNGVFKLRGYGPFGDKFIAMELSENSAAKRNRGRLAFGSDATEAKQNLQATNQARQWNIIERTSLLLDVGVIGRVAPGIVRLYDFQTTTPRYVYDPEATTIYTFDTSKRTATVLLITNGTTTSYSFDFEIIENTSSDSGIFQLRNGGSITFNNWYYGMKFKDNKIALISNQNLVALKSELDTIDMNISTESDKIVFYLKSAAERTSEILTELSQDTIVSLNMHRAYVDHTIEEFIFNPATTTVQVISKTNGRIERSVVYKTIVVKDFQNDSSGSTKSGTLLLTGAASAPLNNRFLSIVQPTASQLGTGIDDDLTINTFKMNFNSAQTTAENMSTIKFLYHRKTPLIDNEKALESFATMYNGEWTLLYPDDNRQYTYDHNSTEFLTFDYTNKLLYYTQKENSTETKGEYALWVTNIPSVTDNDDLKVTVMLKHVSGTHNRFNHRFASFKLSDIKDSAYRGIDWETPLQAINRRDDGRDPTMIPLIHATNSPAFLSNWIRLGHSTCWFPVDDGYRMTNGMVYKPSHGGGHSDVNNPGGNTVKHVRLGDYVPANKVEIGTVQGSSISAEKLSRFFTRIIESLDPYNGIFRTYGGFNHQRTSNVADNTYIDPLTNGQNGRLNMSNAYHAISVGVGPNLYKAKVAYGESVEQVRANLNALTYYNYVSRNAEATTVNTIASLFDTSGSKNWVGESMTFSMVNKAERLISVRGNSENESVGNTYRMEHLYSGQDHPHHNETSHQNGSGNRYVFKLIGFGPYANRIVRVRKDSNYIKFVIGNGYIDSSGVVDIDKQWYDSSNKMLTNK